VSRLSVFAFAVLLVLAVLVAVRFSPQDQAPDPLDDRVVAYVFDDMLPAWAATIVQDCKLPSRAIKGVLRVKTGGGAVAFDGWKWSQVPPNWSEETRQCLERRLAGRSSSPAPARLDVPEGREYEVDVDFTIPVSTTFQ
jgi:hypothetical protein